MLKAITSRLVAIPGVYDLVQALNGAHHTNPFLVRQFAQTPPNALVLDVGGGTGRIGDLWPHPCRYVCADPDPAKLRGFRAKRPDGAAVLADGGHLPIESDSIDVAVCVAISHHMPEDVLKRTITEVRRVLRPNGRFIFYDAVWAPHRGAGRLLWRYDQGSFPRSPGVLDGLLRAELEPIHRERVVYWHSYLLWVGRPIKRPDSTSA
jgi:SAM-dependent methyltransferase